MATVSETCSRGSIDTHLKLWFLKNYHSPFLKGEWWVFLFSEGKNGDEPTGGPDSVDSLKVHSFNSQRISEPRTTIFQRTPKTQSQKKKKSEQRSKTSVTFSFLKNGVEWECKHPNLSTVKSQHIKPRETTSDAIYQNDIGSEKTEMLKSCTYQAFVHSKYLDGLICCP